MRACIYIDPMLEHGDGRRHGPGAKLQPVGPSRDQPFFLHPHNVCGELVGGNVGLGYLLTFGEGQANTPMVFVSIVLLTAIGSLAYLAVVVMEQRVLHYLPARDRRVG